MSSEIWHLFRKNVKGVALEIRKKKFCIQRIWIKHTKLAAQLRLHVLKQNISTYAGCVAEFLHFKTLGGYHSNTIWTIHCVLIPSRHISEICHAPFARNPDVLFLSFSFSSEHTSILYWLPRSAFTLLEAVINHWHLISLAWEQAGQ